MEQVTKAFYDGNPEGYSESTFGNDVSDIRRRFLSRLDPGARILDLGCGSGRDTLAFREAGYEVVPVDGSEGMCRVASSNTGSKVRCLDILDLDYVDEFDGVWACASLLHLGSREIQEAFRLIRRALREGGAAFVSFKEGTFEGFRDGRWYTDMTPDGFRDIVSKIGFTMCDLWLSKDYHGITWVNSIIQKNSGHPDTNFD